MSKQELKITFPPAEDTMMRLPLLLAKMQEWERQCERVYGKEGTLGLTVYTDLSGSLLGNNFAYGRHSAATVDISFNTLAEALERMNILLRAMEKQPDYDPTKEAPAGAEP